MLTGKYQNGALPEGARFTNYRNAGKRQQIMANRFVNSRALASTTAFAEIAAEAGMELTTLATAWSKQHDFVASTIIGVTSAEQLDPILAAADVTSPASSATTSSSRSTPLEGQCPGTPQYPNGSDPRRIVPGFLGHLCESMVRGLRGERREARLRSNGTRLLRL